MTPADPPPSRAGFEDTLSLIWENTLGCPDEMLDELYAYPDHLEQQLRDMEKRVLGAEIDIIEMDLPSAYQQGDVSEAMGMEDRLQAKRTRLAELEAEEEKTEK